jgi:hypothetical protein
MIIKLIFVTAIHVRLKERNKKYMLSVHNL